MTDVLTNRVRKTRKPVLCWGCRRTICAGSMVRKFTSVDMGEVDTVNICAVCDETARNFMWWHWEGMAEGDIKELYAAPWEQARMKLEDSTGEVGADG